MPKPDVVHANLLHPTRNEALDVQGIPKTDIHVHVETYARLDRFISARDNRPPYDWNQHVRWLTRLQPGMPRLLEINGDLDIRALEEPRENGDYFPTWLQEMMRQAAEERAILVEIRFGARYALRSEFMSIFREAERQVQRRYPDFHAEAVISGICPSRQGATEVLDACLSARCEGLAGIDFFPEPYDSEADWTEAYRWAARAAEAGLGITAHVGEFSEANIIAALRMPGLTRLGHAVHAVDSPELLSRVRDAGCVRW